MRRDSPFHMSDISAWYAFIQMFLISTAEILVNPEIYQFASDVAPNQLMSIVQSSNLVSGRTFSNCITGPLSNVVFLIDKDWNMICNKGPTENGWDERYWQPFLEMDHLPYPSTLDMIVPLSAASGVKLGTVDFTNQGDRYAIQSMHSDTWWDSNLTEFWQTRWWSEPS